MVGELLLHVVEDDEFADPVKREAFWRWLGETLHILRWKQQ